MIQVDNYKKSSYGPPSDDISPEEKEKKEYCLAFSEWFLSLYFRDEFATTWVDRDEIFVLRKYGVGDQSEETAMRMCYGVNDQFNTVRKGWYNINWAILQIAQKYRNAYLGMFSDIDFEILCESQDQYSKKEKEDKAYGLYVQKKMRPFMAQQMGVQLPASEVPEPDSIQELLVYQQLGVYKNAFELASEKFLRETFETFSNWNLETKRMVLEDFWDVGKAVIRDSIDRVTQKIKIEYCDIANCIIRKDHEGRILDGGVIKIMSISDVRAESAACGQPLSEDQLMECGLACKGAFGNPVNWDFGRDTPLYNHKLGCWAYDNWKVAVLDCEYRTSDTKMYTEKTKDNKKTYYKEKFDKNLKDTPTKKRISKAKINYYRCKLPLGTKHAYDYGQQYDIPRPDKSEAHSSFHYAKLPGFSPVHTIRPVLDHVQLAWVKFQNAWAKAKPDGYWYDEAKIKNSTIGSKLTVDEIVRMSEQTGRLFIKSTDKFTNPANNASSLPVGFMQGGIGTALQEFVDTWNHLINMLQELTGLTPQASASPLPAKTGKAVSEIQLSATTNILKPIIQEYKKIKRSVSKTCLLRGMITFKYSEEICKDYYDVLGEDTVEILKMATKSAAQLGINLVPQTSAELKAELKDAAVAAMQIGRDGNPQLTFPEFLTVLNLINASVSPDYIRAILAKMVSEGLQRAQQEKEALIQLQSKGNQESTLVATEGKKEEISFETNEKIRLRAWDALMKGFEEKMKTENSMNAEAGLLFIQNAMPHFMPTQQGV